VRIVRWAAALVGLSTLFAALAGCSTLASTATSPTASATYKWVQSQSPLDPGWSTHYPVVVPGQIPYVTGLTLERARQRLAKAGFTHTTLIGATPNAKTTLVITVLPREGSKHPTSTVIALMGQQYPPGTFDYPTPGP